jgi:hypothetical protein
MVSTYKVPDINFYIICPYLQITSVEAVCWILHHDNFSLQLNLKKQTYFIRVMQDISKKKCLTPDRLKVRDCMKMLMKISDSRALNLKALLLIASGLKTLCHSGLSHSVRSLERHFGHLLITSTIRTYAL